MASDQLDSTRWALEYLTLDGVSHMVSGRRIPELAFLAGRVSGDDGVNTGVGTFRHEGELFSTAITVSQKVPYPSERLPEHDLFRFLALVDRAGMHGDFLHLRFDGGELVYRWEADEFPA